MKDSKKLNLNNLKVESFVTTLDNNQINTVKAGSSHGCFGMGVVVGFTLGTIAATLVALEVVDAVGDAVQGVSDAIGGKTEGTSEEGKKKKK